MRGAGTNSRRRRAMKILIAWMIAQIVGLLLWQPFGRAAKRGDE